ncbi:MAG: macro domain-containing protein [Candidatus Aenigmatarchaeota archaeon]
MLSIANGSIFDSSAECLVNPVNCFGVSGRGLALEFKKNFPDNYRAYRKACLKNELKIGHVFIFKTSSKTIANFPTKYHWRQNSNLIILKKGLISLRNKVIEHQIHSIAIPAVGCGLGQLNWNDVFPMIIEFAESVPNLEIFVYPPLK